ncbi:MAG: energy transducer TonB [Myxococcota bacterium]
MADEPPSLVSDAQPRYPVAAAEDGIEADVTLMLTVTAEGRVRDAKLVRPAGADFDRAALAAAKQLRFRAARVDGLAVASRVRWICQFRLN